MSGVVQRERSHLKKTKPLAVTRGASYLRAGEVRQDKRLRRVDSQALKLQLALHSRVLHRRKSGINAVSVNTVLIGANLPIAPVVRPQVLAALQEPQAD